MKIKFNKKTTGIFAFSALFIITSAFLFNKYRVRPAGLTGKNKRTRTIVFRKNRF